MKYLKVIGFVPVLIIFLSISFISSAQDVPRMSKENLKAVMEEPELVIIDVRTASDWESSELKIRGAIREEPLNAKSWAHKYKKEKTYVLYCA